MNNLPQSCATFISLQNGEVDIQTLMRQHIGRQNDTVGAIDSFIGVVRSSRLPQLQNSSLNKGWELTHLEVDAVVAMAEQDLKRISQAINQVWSLKALTIVHRLGAIPVGEVICSIWVSAQHRVEARNACNFFADALKSQVTLFKREVYQPIQTESEATAKSLWLEPKPADIQLWDEWLCSYPPLREAAWDPEARNESI